MHATALLALVGATTTSAFTWTDGTLSLEWSFEGEGADEVIDMSFTLPSDIYIGIGLDCQTSADCDMIVGNGGGRNPAFIEDYNEVEGNREPHTDVELGGTSDVELVEAKYENWESTLRFRRKLDTKDKWDAVIKKVPMDIVYAWCEEPFCVDVHSAHAPGSWGMVQIDFSGENGLDFETEEKTAAVV